MNIRNLPEPLQAVFLLLGTFVVGLVVEYCLLIAGTKMPGPGGGGIDWIGYAVMSGPYVVTLLPGVWYLFSRKWITAVVLLVAGWPLALGIVLFATMAAWATPLATH